jgi:hypothetical protein
MPSSKDSLPSTSAPSLGELLRRQRQRQQESASSAPPDNAEGELLRRQRQRQQESASSAPPDNAEESDQESTSSVPPDNAEESNPLSSSGLLSFTAATQQHESGSSAQGNVESNNNASHPRTSRAQSLDSLRSIIDQAIAVLDDEEVEDSATSTRRDDSNPPQ